MKILSLLFCFFLCLQTKAQLGFCSGSKGDPIFQEDFGTGTGTGEEFEAGATNYTFVEGDPNDGQYTVSDEVGTRFSTWYSSLPQTTISNGRALIVNADFTAGRFYRTEISGLCENTTYEFSAFLMNVHRSNTGVCPGGDIPINVRFEIWDETDSVLLKSGDTGNINSSSTAKWEQYALTFSSEPGQDTVILKMYNNGEGGCGNDLAIDDIIFRSCGDLTTITSTETSDGRLSVCEEDSPATINLQANPDNSVYEEHYFQWQRSSDAENWQDIPGATGANYQETGIDSSVYFRVKVAEDPVNLLSNTCSSASEAFFVQIVETPEAPISNGDIIICSDETIPSLRVEVAEDEIVYWYDAATGEEIIAENTSSFVPETEGIYYAEARKEYFDCTASPRTAIQLTINEIPQVNDEILQICAEFSLTIDAGRAGMEYEWNTGENTQQISIDSPGNYSVILTNQNGCSTTKNIIVESVVNAEISEIISEEASVTILSVTRGDFLYSLDGEEYQTSNIFEFVSAGIYTAYIKDTQSCNIDTREFPHLVIPNFITPNNDGYNDSFKMDGIEYFDHSEIQIYDRYGKLLKAGRGEEFTWKGILNGTDLPADDYWYLIRIAGFPDRKGSFSLIR